MSYIKREDALDAVLFALVGTGYQSNAIDAIRDVPTADVVEVRHGYWIRDAHCEAAYCSLCDGITPVDCEKELFYESDFCPSCGAKMDGEKGERNEQK